MPMKTPMSVIKASVGDNVSNDIRYSFLKRIWISLLQIFFILMLVVPTTLQTPRGMFLVLITGIASVVSMRVWSVSKEIFLLWMMTFLVGLSGVLFGLMEGAPGALSVITVYLIWPILYLLYIGLAHSLDSLRSIESALLWGIALATSMALLVMFAGLLGYKQYVYPLLEFQGAAFGNYGGRIEFRTFGLTTVMYGFPFVLAYMLVRRDELHGFRKVFIYLLLSAIVLAALSSGRRAFWLVILIAPLFLIFFLQISSSRLKMSALFSLGFKFFVLSIFTLATIIVSLELDPIALSEVFLSAFQGQEASSGARYIQAASLWQAFTVSPVIGHGFGSTVDIVRSHEQPWAYELSYLALLMNVGVVGFLIYSLAVLWIAFKGLQISRENQEFSKLFIPLFTALCSFLVMNATNPYLAKFDYLWVIFLPVALINAYLTKRNANA